MIKKYSKKLSIKNHKKKSNTSREVFDVGDLVRIHTPSNKTRQVWSYEVYEFERV